MVLGVSGNFTTDGELPRPFELLFCNLGYFPLDIYWAVAQLMDGAASEQTFEDALYKSVETRANETVIRVELCLRLGVQAAMSASVIPALEQRSFSASICFYSQA